MELCVCGGLNHFNSYFQRWECTKCKAWRTNEQQKVIRKYMEMKYENQEHNTGSERSRTI